MGIEPTFLAWEANVLPLNYTRSPILKYVALTPAILGEHIERTALANLEQKISLRCSLNFLSFQRYAILLRLKACPRLPVSGVRRMRRTLVSNLRVFTIRCHSPRITALTLEIAPAIKVNSRQIVTKA